jgi:hypothetical protein
LALDAALAILARVIERIVRVANSFEEAAEMDRGDIAALSFEERISGVERLRRVWFGEDRAESRLERVLVCADLPSRSLPPDRGARGGGARRAAPDGRSGRVRRADPRKLQNKRASGREKDLRDVALLEEQRPRVAVDANARARPRSRKTT